MRLLIFLILLVPSVAWAECNNPGWDYGTCKTYCEHLDVSILDDYCPSICSCNQVWLGSQLKPGYGVEKIDGVWVHKNFNESDNNFCIYNSNFKIQKGECPRYGLKHAWGHQHNLEDCPLNGTDFNAAVKAHTNLRKCLNCGLIQKLTDPPAKWENAG